MDETRANLNYNSKTTPVVNVGMELEEFGIRLVAFERRVNLLEKQICEKLEATKCALKRRKGNNDSDYGDWKGQLADKTTIHGLKDLLTEHHKTRCYAWGLIFATALACSGFYVSKVWVEYNEDPTATKVEVLTQEEYDYPIILLCPDPWLDADKAYSIGITETSLQYALGYLINYGVRKAPYRILDYHKSKQEFEQWWYNGNGAKFKTLAEFFKFIALDRIDFVQSCSYCQNVTQQSNLFAKIIMNQGVCYNLTLLAVSGRVALSELDYLHVKMPKRSGGLLAERSYWRFIINPDMSLGMSDTHYLQVFPNHSNTIRVMTHHFKSLPNVNCVTREYVREYNYSQSACVADCFTISRNSCLPYPLVRSDAIPKDLGRLCNTAGWVAVNVTLPESAIEDTPPNCIEKCPSLCEKWVYESSIQAHVLEMLDEKGEGLTSFHFLNQAVHYGGILSHEEVLTYSFETFISNFGGQMGLWLGASLMSWVELIMFLITCTCGGLWKKRKKMRKSHN